MFFRDVISLCYDVMSFRCGVMSFCYGGAGMIASSSTFRLHPGRVIRDLFRLLNAVYGIVRKH